MPCGACGRQHVLDVWECAGCGGGTHVGVPVEDVLAKRIGEHVYRMAITCPTTGRVVYLRQEPGVGSVRDRANGGAWFTSGE